MTRIPHPRTPDHDVAQPDVDVPALVARAQAGDAEAFGQIYDRYFDTVFRYVYFRVRNRQLAEDITGDVWLRALRNIGRFTWQGKDFGAWPVTIARNAIADYYKSGRYRLEVPNGGDLTDDRADHGPEGDPEGAVVERFRHDALPGLVWAAVADLTDEQRTCIVLRYQDGLSVADTAHAMGKTEGAVKALTQRAGWRLARLHPELAEMKP
jgi:RNA polymerase sigma-70 factor, ECF subfamily